MSKIKTQNYLCVDVRTEMIDRDMKVGEQRKVWATLDPIDNYGDPEGHFTLREIAARPSRTMPELQWRLLDRSKHGKVSVNARHVKVEFYIHHGEYSDGRDLADMLAREIETLGEQMCETCFEEEVPCC